MNYIDTIVNLVINNFNFAFMLIINVVTYGLIKGIDFVNKDKKVPTYQKRIALVFAIILVAVIYKLVGYSDNICLVNSAILAPVSWSWIIRPIFMKFNIGYKQIDDTIE